MLKLTLFCTLFLICSQNESTEISNSRPRRQVPQMTPTTNNSTAPGTVIRRTNVPTHKACEKLCREEKMIKCLFIKYISDQKMCYLTDKEITSMAVTESTAKPPDSDDEQKLKDLLKLLSISSTNKKPSTKKQVITHFSPKKGSNVIKQASKVIPKTKEPSEITIKLKHKKTPNSVAKPNPLSKTVQELRADLEDAKRKGQLNSNEMKEKLKDLEEYLNKIRELRKMINAIGSTIAGNFTRLREVQIRSLLHFNKRLHNIYRDLMKTKEDVDKMTAMMKGLKGNDTAHKEYVLGSIADLKRSKDRFGAAIRSLQQRIAKLHLDMASFHQLMRVIISNLNSMKRQQISRLEMQRFQELSLRSLAHLHHRDRSTWRRIRRLEQNIRLVAHAVVLSQIEESKSRVLIKKINKELQALKGAVKNSYIWHNVQLLGGFHGSGFNMTVDNDHMHKTLITYIRELNEANIERYRKMSQRMNTFLLKTLQGVSKIEKRRKWLARNRIETMKQVLRSSLRSLSVWTGRVKEVVNTLDEKIDRLTQKTQKLSEGSKIAELDSHHLKEKMEEVNKKEEKLAGSLKNLEATNMKSAAQLQQNLQDQLKKTIERQSDKLQRKTEKKIQSAITSAQNVDQKLEKMKQTEAKKLQETKEKIENKVKTAVEKVSNNVARDQILAARHEKELQLQKKKVTGALKKLTALGNVQLSNLKEKVEAIMNEKTDKVDKSLRNKLSKIKDAVGKSLHSVSSTSKKDHKQLKKLRTQFGEFLNGLKVIEKQRKEEGKKNVKEAERKRKQDVSRVLAATTRKVEKLQQRMNEKNQRQIGKLVKKLEKAEDKIKNVISVPKSKEKMAAKKVSKIKTKEQLLAAQKAELQSQKNKIRKALKKLTALGNVQFSKLKENIEAIMNEKSGSVEKNLTGKFSKIKDAVGKTLHSVSSTKAKDHKQLQKLRMQFDEFLMEVKDMEKQRKKVDKKIAQEAERKRNKKVGKILAATTRRVEELQQRMNKKNQRKMDKLKKELKTAEGKIKKEIAAQKSKEEMKKEENRLVQKKMDELKQKILEKNKAMKQKEKESNKKIQQIANQLSKVETQKARTDSEKKRKEEEKAKLKEKISKIQKKTKEMAIAANKKEEDLKKKLEITKIKAKIDDKGRKYKMKMKQIQETQQKQRKILDALKKNMQKEKALAEQEENKATERIQLLENRQSKLSTQKAISRLEHLKNEEEKAKLTSQIARMKKKTKKVKDSAKERNKNLKKKIKKVERNMEKVTKIKNELIKKEDKMKQAEKKAKEKIRRLIEQLKESKQKEAEEKRQKYKTRHKMKVVPQTGEHGKIPPNAVKVPFPKKEAEEKRQKYKTGHKMKVVPKTGKHGKIPPNAAKVPFPEKGKEVHKGGAKEKVKPSKKKEGAVTRTQQEKENHRHKMRVMPKTEKHINVPANAAKVPFSKIKELSEKLKENRKKYNVAKQKVLETKKKLHDEMKEKKELSLLPAKTKKDKNLINKQKEEIDRRITTYRRICRISREEMQRRREWRRRLQEKYRKERIGKEKKEGRIYHRKHRLMKIQPQVEGQRHVPVGAAKISFSKSKEILQKLKENRKKYNRAEKKFIQTKNMLQAKIKEKKGITLLPANTIKDKKLINKRKEKLNREIKTYIRICRISREEMKRRREWRRRLQEKYRRERLGKLKEQGKRYHRKHRIMKILPPVEGQRQIPGGVANISFSKRKAILERLEENKKKYNLVKKKIFETKKKLREKIEEKKEMSLLRPKTIKDKELIQKRKEKLKRKIENYLRICRISVNELKRKRERRKRLQEKIRRVKEAKEHDRRNRKHHVLKIVPGLGRERYIPRGDVKISFSKRKELLQKLNDNKEKYKLVKQKLSETKKKLQAKIKEKKELSVLPAKTLKEKKLIQKRKEKLQRNINKYLRICRISGEELRRRRERRRRLQELYRREKVGKGKRYKKHHKMKIIPEVGTLRYVSGGGVEISFSKRKELLQKLNDNKEKYKLVKQKLSETKKKLRAKIEEKKDLSMLPAKTLKEKKLIQKRKEKLKRKINKYLRICRISGEELRRRRERRRRLQELYRRKKVGKGRRHKKHHKMKIIPGVGKLSSVSRGVKISFANSREILEQLKINKNKYKQAKETLLKTKEKLRAKVKEKKELALLPAKTLKEKKMLQKRKEKLKQKIKTYIRICRVSREELRRRRERKRRLQEKKSLQKEKVGKGSRHKIHRRMKIIPGVGKLSSRGGVKISFAKSKEILEQLKINKKKYMEAKRKLVNSQEKLRATTKEKKELALLPAKTLKEKKMLQKRKEKLKRKIKNYRRICRISREELKRRRERKRKLQEKYPLQKGKKIMEKLKINKKKYKQAKQKLSETKKKLRTEIKEKKELSLIPAKILKEKKMLQKRKEKLKRKIKNYRRICRISREELKRRRERKRRLQEIYSIQKPKYKKMSMKIVPLDNKNGKLPKGTQKIMFKRRNPK